MKTDQSLQGKCEHPKAVENLRTETEQQASHPIDGPYMRRVILRHMECPRCGMLFAREIWG
jgi:hypothetical protein